MAVSDGGVWVVVLAVILVSAVASVLQVKQQLRQEKGPLVVLGDARLQLLLLWHPGSSTWSSAVVYRCRAGGPGFMALGAVQARTATDGLAFGAQIARQLCGRAAASIK